MEFLTLSDELRRIPFVRLLLPFLAGIIVTICYKPLSPPWVIWIPVCSFSLACIFHFISKNGIKTRWVYTLFLNLFLLFFGWSYTSFKLQAAKDTLSSPIAGNFIGEILEADSGTEGRIKGSLRIRMYKISDHWVRKNIRVLYSIPKSDFIKALSSGDWISFEGSLLPQADPGNPGEFNYRKYLLARGIAGRAVLNSSNASLLTSIHTRSLKSLSERLRDFLQFKFSDNGIAGEQLNVLSALVLGDRSEVSDEVLRHYSGSGAMHVLAVSGLHVGIIFLLISYFLSFLKHVKGYRWIRLVLGLTFLWFYAILTGSSPSVLRASAMFSFVLAGSTFQRSGSVYNSIAASAFCILLFNPMYLREVGFQLSYAAVISIISFYQPIYNLVNCSGWLTDKLWSLMSLSLTAQLGTFPLGMYYFHQFPNWFLLTNIIVVPLAGLILYFSMGFFIFSWVKPLASILGYLLNKIVFVLNQAVSMVDSLPGAVTSGISLDFQALVSLYLLVITICMTLLLKRYFLIMLSLLMAIFFMLIMLFETIQTYRQKELIVYSFNGEVLADIIHGRKCLAVATKGISEKPWLVKMKADPYRLRLKLDPERYIFIDSVNTAGNPIEGISFLQISKGILLAHNDQQKIAIVTSGEALSDLCPKTPVVMDYVVVSKRCCRHLKDITSVFSAPVIIGDFSVPPWIDDQLFEEAAAAGIRYYSIRKNGAFIARL